MKTMMFHEWSVFLYDDTLGITQRALTATRNVLAARVENELQVYRVPASDGNYCDAYGLVILDRRGEIDIIGDGFRGDNSGEGGAGHRAVQALLVLFGIKVSDWCGGITYSSDLHDYESILAEIINLSNAERWVTPSQENTQYIDWCFRR